MVDETQEQLTEALAPTPEAPEPPPEVPVEPAPEPVPPPEPEAAIPSWRLREEAEGRRAAEDRARALETRLQQIDQHLKQTQRPAQQPDFFDNPDAATQAAINRVLVPYAKQVHETLLFMGRQVAEARHGPEKVAEAEQAFLDARDKRALDPADFQRVVSAPNRYDAVVQWHKRHSTLNAVGEDPNAWFEKQLEARLADPKFQAQVLERARNGATTRPTTTKLPPSLSRATAAAGNSGEPIGDLSDASLFAFATKP